MCTACWITQATTICSECVLLIACLLQHRLREHDSMSHNMYNAGLVIIDLNHRTGTKIILGKNDV